ncbi:MAG TPA: glycoside hydrolase family 2 TIM barrel-domain containing protein [Terriglobales bacterium]|nr:glycoside hydrolase family 2 TIM barrel-domain containing protein [Terriglobales bacterium]
MAETDIQPTRTVVDLNGDWERYVHGKLVDIVAVPSSLRPSGLYRLRRNFLLPKLSNGNRAIVHFDAINYHGRIFVNGHELGVTIPYLPFEFDFTGQATEGRNMVEVQIADAAAEPDGTGKDEIEYTAPGGWEPYGGIIRDVYVDVRPATFIDNVRFGYELTADLENASCTSQLFISSTESASAECELSLWWRHTQVATGTVTVQLKPGTTEAEIKFDAKSLALWSPEEPNLYHLKAQVKTASAKDFWQCRTGFRELKTKGRLFLLNGKRLIMNGVCRHDMWKDQGFTLSRRQQEQDMRMIKAMGANFVRLVHYPHDKRIVDLADELGLVVSEEPGFWNMDFDKMPKEQVDLGCEILERTIKRDWNSPSIGVWFLGNECTFPVSYLKRGKAICDKLDPIHRLVSVAHTYGKPPEVKKVFDDSGLDFYDWHAYDYDEHKFTNLANVFGPEKPFTFSEWGWEVASPEAVFYERDFDTLLELVEEGKVSGHMFWSWNDMNQFTRKDWASFNGILFSGAVTDSRELREPIYSRLAALFNGRREVPNPSQPRPTVLPLKILPFTPGSSFKTTDLQSLVDSEGGKKSWSALESALEKFWAGSVAEEQWKRTGSKFTLWPAQDIRIAGVSFSAPAVENRARPVLLTEEAPEVTIPVNQACTKLHILGQVTMPVGFPLTGKRGDVVAVYTFRYANGKTQDIPVRNGFEVAQSNRIHSATRIDPIAVAAQPAVEYIKDVVREQYQLLLWSVPTQKEKLVSVRCKLNTQQAPLAIFAVTTEQSAS